MKKKTTILGIETSCDETAVSIIQENGSDKPLILSNVVSSQVDVHKDFGGVVPELAARSHIEKIDLIAKKAIDESGIKLEDVDAVAATAGPGLIVCLSVGLSFGKAMAASLNKPFIAVNHLEGHALSPKLDSKLNYPYLLLLISGGHTQFLSVKGLGEYKRLGTTIDDALGEAFDKTAKMLGKWVHVGRVNTAERVKNWIGLADSIDGSGISQYDHMLENVLRAINGGVNQELQLDLAV